MTSWVYRAIALSIFAITGCGSSTFIVKSDPLDADVYFIDAKSGDKKPLGKTPLNMPISDVKHVVGDSLGSGAFFRIGVEKKGFQPEEFSVPTTTFGTMVTDLEVKLKQSATDREARLAKDIINHLFLAQKFALSSQYERAQIEIDKVLATFSNFPRALSMRASIYFAQKNYIESLKWYEEALKADPEMEDVVKLVAKVRALQGLPPGTPPPAADATRVPSSAPNAAPAQVPAAIAPAAGTPAPTPGSP